MNRQGDKGISPSKSASTAQQTTPRIWKVKGRQGDFSPLPLVPLSPCLAFSPSYIQVPLPEGHRFPMGKYAALVERLEQLGWNIERADRATQEDLQRVHTNEYIQTWFNLALTPQEERKLGLPQSAELLERSLCSVGGTVSAMMQAFETGYGVNLAGGTHHAFADRGEGFCVFNDLAIASRKAMTEGLAKKMLIVDLDVHQGNGTAKIFENEPNVFTFSIHGERNYPFQKEKSDLDIGLPDGTTDEQYLEVLSEQLPSLFETFAPDLVFLQAGVDVLMEDRYGRMNLTKEGVAQRDGMVYKLCFENAVPLVYTMGGGYQKDIEKIVEAHVGSLEALRQLAQLRVL
jgi:acetoin utilization deacetylase AcuC-like enzyme